MNLKHRLFLGIVFIFFLAPGLSEASEGISVSKSEEKVRKPLAEFFKGWSRPGARVSKKSQEEVDFSIKKALGAYFDKPKSYALGPIEVVKDGEGGYDVSGSGEFFDLPSVAFKAKMRSKTHPEWIKLEFPGIHELTGKHFSWLGKGQALKSWFPSGFGAVNIEYFELKFEKDTSRFPTSASARLSSPKAWEVFRMGGFMLDDVGVLFSINNLQERKKEISLSLEGGFNAAGARVELSGSVSNGRQTFELAAKVNDLTLGNFLKAVCGNTTIQGIEIPEALLDLGVQDAQLSLVPDEKTFTCLASSSFGELEVKIEPEGRGSQKKLGFLVGIAPPQEFEFASIDPDLSMLDNVGLTNCVMAVSTDQRKTDLAIFKSIGGKEIVTKGLTLMAGYNLHEVSKDLADFIGESTIVIKAYVPPNPLNIKLEAALNTNIEFDKEGTVTFKKINFSIRPNPSDFTLAMGGEIEVKANRDILTFRAECAVEISPLVKFSFTGMMMGDWTNPFGIAEELTLSDLGFTMGLTLTAPIPLPTVGITGALKVGEFEGDATIVIDAANPTECLIDVGFQNGLKLNDVVKSFCSRSAYNNIPDFVRDEVMDVGLTEARIMVVPKAMEVFGRMYDPGFMVSGKGSFVGVDLELLVRLSLEGFEFKAGMEAIDHAPWFAVKGTGEEENPVVHVKAILGSEAFFKINGSLTILGITSETDIMISSDGFRGRVTGRIWDFAEAELTLVAPFDLSKSTMYSIAGHFTTSDLTDIDKKISAQIDASSKQAQKDISKLQDDLAKARARASEFERVFIDIAQGLLDGVKEMEKGVSAAGKYIVENTLANMLLLEHVGFAVNMDAASTTKVDLEMRAIICGERSNLKFATEFTSPNIILENMAEEVMDEIANSAFAKEMEKFFEDMGASFEAAWDDFVAAMEEFGEAVVAWAEQAAYDIYDWAEPIVSDIAEFAGDAAEEVYVAVEDLLGTNHDASRGGANKYHSQPGTNLKQTAIALNGIRWGIDRGNKLVRSFDGKNWVVHNQQKHGGQAPVVIQVTVNQLTATKVDDDWIEGDPGEDLEMIGDVNVGLFYNGSKMNLQHQTWKRDRNSYKSLKQGRSDQIGSETFAFVMPGSEAQNKGHIKLWANLVEWDNTSADDHWGYAGSKNYRFSEMCNWTIGRSTRGSLSKSQGDDAVAISYTLKRIH